MPRADSGRSAAALIVNGASRAGAKGYGPARQALLRRGMRLIRSEAVTDPGAIPDAIHQAVSVGCRLVIVGGGDGTVGCAAGMLARLPGERVALGVLPLGTANDFARTLHIPADVESACAVVAAGKVVDVDVGWANDLPFVNAASLGLSVAAARTLRPAMKRALGPAAYPVSVLLAYHRHRPFSVSLEFPEGDRHPVQLTDVLQLAVGNGRYYGGGHTIAPHASIDDHSLDVYAIKTGRVWDHISLARLLRDGHVVEHDDVEHLVTRALRLDSDQPQPVNLDGEIATTTPLEVWVQRNAVDVVVPEQVSHLRRDAG